MTWWKKRWPTSRRWPRPRRKNQCPARCRSGADAGANRELEDHMLRRRRPLVRAVGVAATTAVVAGTAGAVHHHQQQKYAQQNAAAQQQQYLAYQQGMADAQAQHTTVCAAAAAVCARASASPAAGSDLTAQLQQLAQLHTAGVLSDEEFAAAKAEAPGRLMGLAQWVTSEAGVLCESRLQRDQRVGFRCAPGCVPGSNAVLCSLQPLHYDKERTS